MPRDPTHTPYHPKWYRRRMPIFWWLGHARYTRFIARELTSVFVAYGAAVMLVYWWALIRGEAAYGRLAAWLASPAVVTWHVVVLVAVLFHAVTWLNLAPRALVPRLRGREVPSWAVIAAHYAAWLAVTGALLWVLT